MKKKTPAKAPPPPAPGAAGSSKLVLSRRELLRYMSLAAAIPLVDAACGRPDRLPAHWGPPPGPTKLGARETFVTSVCGGCPGGCGIKARIAANRLVGLAGNPLHPINRGGLCPLGLSGPHVVYHPDRIHGPLLRSRRTDELRPVSWQEAIAEVSTRLRDLRAKKLAHTVALIDGTRGLSRDAAKAFMAAYGSPNHLSGRAWNDVAPTEAQRAMQGTEVPAAYDLENARFILAFGSDWLEGASSPVNAARAYGAARRGRKNARARVVHVEARLSVSAAHADEWIPVMPGTEGVLALGLMHMILREGLDNAEFLERWGYGFDWLRAIVLRDYHPDAVSEHTGVPVATIISLARRFASTRPAIALGDDRNGPGTQSVEARMAIHALNALVGGINVPGGVLTPYPVPIDPLPAPASDELAKGGLATPAIGSPQDGITALAAWQDGHAAYPINLLLAHGADPVGALGGGDRARAALKMIPFVVSFSSFLDETALQADVVLPDHTYLEKWQDAPTFTSRGFPVFGLRQPVLKPRHDTRHASETLAEIGRGVGGPVAETLPWTDFKEVIRRAAKGIHRSGRGALFDVPETESWVETMERSGWRATNAGSFDEFWSGLCSRGGWWDPVYDFGERSRAMRAAGGKFDFGRLAKSVEASRSQLGPAAAAPAAYPLRLHLYPLATAFGDSSAPLPFVQDVLARDIRQKWGLWVELSAPDARSLHVAEGAQVQVESASGAVEARVKVHPGLRPGVVAMPLGPGGAPGDACRRAFSQQSATLVALAKGPGGEPIWDETWVRIRKA